MASETKTRFAVVDYNESRVRQLAGYLRANFKGDEVEEVLTRAPADGELADVQKLREITERGFDFLICHLGGNPSGYDCIAPFKKNNPRGRVIVYTKLAQLPLKQIPRLRLADYVFQRSADDTKALDESSTDAIIAEIDRLKKTPAIDDSEDISKKNIRWFADRLSIPQVWAILGAMVAMIGGSFGAGAWVGGYLKKPGDVTATRAATSAATKYETWRVVGNIQYDDFLQPISGTVRPPFIPFDKDGHFNDEIPVKVDENGRRVFPSITFTPNSSEYKDAVVHLDQVPPVHPLHYEGNEIHFDKQIPFEKK